MKITSSKLKYYFRRSEKGFITSLCPKTIVRSKKYKKKSRFSINNVSMKDLSKIINEFERLPYNGFVQKRPKHEPTESYLYLSIHLAKCMMISDDFN